MSKKRNMSQSSVILGLQNKTNDKLNVSSTEISDMITLLKQYETMCIQKEDFGLADEAKNKIQQLKSQQIAFRIQTLANKQKEQIQSVCRVAEDQIKRFQQFWDIEIKKLIQQLKQIEEAMFEEQKKQLEQFSKKIDKEEVPKIKYSAKILQLRKYLTSLIKSRNYKQAQNVKQKLKEIVALQEIKWVQKHEEKKVLRKQKLVKKQAGQLHALRIKLEATFNQKIKQRDSKFDILLKKNRKRRVQSSKPSRERIRSRNGILTQSKCYLNNSSLRG